MKTRLRHLKKKGAIQMSMQTIIVVVIGVTLLTLGLKFTYDTFAGIKEKQIKMDELTGSELDKLFGQSDESISITPSTTSIKQGKDGEVKIRFRNNGEAVSNAKINIKKIISEGDTTQVSSWFLYDDSEMDLPSGKGGESKVIINVPNSAQLGSYLVKFELACTGSDSCGETVQLILKII